MVLETSSGVGDAAPELRAGAGELLLWPGLAIGWLVQTGVGCLERLSPPRLEKDMARALAVRPEHVRFFLCLFAGYPLGLVYHVLIARLERRVWRLLYIALCGFALIVWLFGISALHSLITVLSVHSIVTYCRGRVAVLLTFSFTMAYLTWVYLTTNMSIGSDYAINASLPQCVLTLRLIGVAFDVLDGARASKLKLKLKQSEPSGKKDAEREQHPDALSAPPSLLELLAYVYFFSASLAGPQFSMRRFQRFVDKQLIPRELQDGIGIVPDCVHIGLSRVMIGVLHLLLYLYGTHCIPDDYLISAEFDALPLWLKVFYVTVWGKVFMYKYTACWLIEEGGCIVSGLSYSGPSERDLPRQHQFAPSPSNTALGAAHPPSERLHLLESESCWGGCTNVYVLQHELSSTGTGVIESYNLSTNRWLGAYIYRRLRWLGSRPLAHLLTLLFVSVWHGVFTGYLMTFGIEFIIVNTERQLREMVAAIPSLERLSQSAGARLALWPLKKALFLYSIGVALVCFNFLRFEVYWKVIVSLKFSAFYHLPALIILFLLSTLIHLKSKKKKKTN